MAKKFDFLSPGIQMREIDQSFIPVGRDAEGPIIIGRTRKGPANKPIKIKNLDDFISVFGAPVPGGTGVQGDVWREGNVIGPTYAAYAAQAWLASEQAPVVMVRLAGVEHPSATTGKAGWQLDNSPDSSAASNGTAYGLFLVDDTAAVRAGSFGTGSLGAIFYANSGYLTLSGSATGDVVTANGSGAFIVSAGPNKEFRMLVYNSVGAVEENVLFNFDRNSSKYIRSVFNTNPQLTNSAIVDSADLKSYWLGESFLREVSDNVSNTAKGSVIGVLLALESGSYNWSDRQQEATEAKSGWVISQRASNQQRLFRFKCLHVGDEFQKNYMIAIEDIKESSNPNVEAYGSFTVSIKDLSGGTVEQYNNVNLNPSSPNYIAKRIGDQYQTWDETNRRYYTYGDFKNLSDYIYVEMQANVGDGGGQGLLPAGFFGPVRPKGFQIASGSLGARTQTSADGTTLFPAAFVKGGAGGTAGALSYAGIAAIGHDNFVSCSVAATTASFNFPKLALRGGGTEGGAPDPYRVHYGIRPKLSSTSNQNDPDYGDYLRGLNSIVDSFTPSTDNFEYSFVFSLDDLIINTNTNVVTYTSGSWSNTEAGTSTSFTSPNNTEQYYSGSFGELLDLNVRQFLMPVWGGTDGFEITEREPIRNDLIGATLAETTNYVQYTLNRALDSVKDPEIVAANLLVMPGIFEPLIANKIITTADSRKDVLAIVDLQGDYIPRAESKDTAANRLGSVTSVVANTKARNLNSSFACAFYPWVQISDNISGGQYVWVPASVAALGALGKSQAQADVWFAPAGFNRGGLGNLGGSRGPAVIQARQRLDSRDRDKLYEVNINPIATFPAEGVVIFGHKTLQSGQSALDRINVRRLVLLLKSKVSAISRNLLFDNNVESTWLRFKSQVDPVLSDIRARFGLTDYKIVLDETTTTPDLIDRNIMYAKIFIKPGRAIEYIVVDFIITKTGADFV